MCCIFLLLSMGDGEEYSRMKRKKLFDIPSFLNEKKVKKGAKKKKNVRNNE